jgi:Domain of unknown function (DUF892)
MSIIEEGQEIMADYKGSPALDAGLLAAAQAVEHYEISRYGTLRTWAEELGLSDAAELLEATLDEEKATDEAPMCSKGGVVVGRIFKAQGIARGPPLDVGERPQRRHSPRVTRLRSHA